MAHTAISIEIIIYKSCCHTKKKSTSHQISLLLTFLAVSLCVETKYVFLNSVFNKRRVSFHFKVNKKQNPPTKNRIKKVQLK